MQKLIEVTIDSVRLGLMSQYRVVVLKALSSERYLTIWIGHYEAEAITEGLQKQKPIRPKAHDLLHNTIKQMGGTVTSIVITQLDLKEDVFYANIMVDLNGKSIEIDARPSDAIALGVRIDVPIYVEESVMDAAASLPDQEIPIDENLSERPNLPEEPKPKAPPLPTEPVSKDDPLNIFRDFLDTLNMDDLGDSDDKQV